MAHQSGIRVGRELQEDFIRLMNGESIRMIKANINGDEVITAHTFPPSAPSQLSSKEYESLIKNAITTDCTSCFLIIRPSFSSSNCRLISFVSDGASVREKMINASTRASLARDLGNSYFSDSLFATVASELSWSAFNSHHSSNGVDDGGVEAGLLSRRELEMKEIRMNEVNAEIGVSTRRQHAGSLSFPLSDDLMAAIEAFSGGQLHALSVQIERESEFVLQKRWEKFTGDLKQLTHIKLPRDTPSFLLMRCRNGGDAVKLVFVYSCPEESSVRNRMIYSSAKTGLLDSLKSLTIDKRLELSDLDQEFTGDALAQELGFTDDAVPAVAVPSHGFVKKLAAPGGRRRLPKETVA